MSVASPKEPATPEATGTDARPSETRTTSSRPRVLVVDDDDVLVRSYARMLSADGYEVEVRLDGEAAVSAVRSSNFDVVLSDIDMPRLGGLALLERIRAHDLDIPVVLITGSPSLETAMAAVEHGALRYLTKPVDGKNLRAVTADAVRLHRLARAKRSALDLAGGLDRLVGDRAGLISSFRSALDTLWIAYQPIVSWSRREVFGYEALLRSRETTLPHPGAIIDAAERLDRLHELGRSIRAAAPVPSTALPPGVKLFVNLHTHDLLDEDLFDPDRPLARVAEHVVLEITERASLHHIRDVQSRIARLREMGYRIAVDDLGAGYAGLTSFAQLEPEVVKLDMSLVRNVHAQPTKQTLVRTMIAMCHELGMQVVAEGIETPEEREAIAEAGCDLMQGYLFAKPGPAFPPVTNLG
jgi:EAL domain-containing protein (putative c-di-GMP-specific phosphodiesterase class I)/ActR/RegA family two-component response regulator